MISTRPKYQHHFGGRAGATVAAAIIAATVIVAAIPSRAADNGAAVSVTKAKKRCFRQSIIVFGTIVPREEVAVRPDREGYQISKVLVDPGDTVTAGQILARLAPRQGVRGATGNIEVKAPVAGIVLKSEAVVGRPASVQAPPLFQIATRGEFELKAELTAAQLSKVSPNQAAIVSSDDTTGVAGQVRWVSPSVDGATQLGQVRIFIGADQRLRVGAFGHAIITTAEKCGVSVPISALQFDGDIAIAAVVRNGHIEIHKIVVGVLSDGDVEVREGLNEGDLVVAKAGAFFREGDRVRPFVDGKPLPNH